MNTTQTQLDLSIFQGSYNTLLRNNPFRSRGLAWLEKHIEREVHPQELYATKQIPFNGSGVFTLQVSKTELKTTKDWLATKYGSYYQGVTEEAARLLERRFKLMVEAYLDKSCGDRDPRPGYASVIRASSI